MKGFYQITETLRDALITAGFNVVTMGDIERIDTQKQTIFPLAHIIPTPVTTTGQINSFGFIIVGMDIVDFRKVDPKDETEMFYGIDNLQDVYHDILYKLQTAIEDFKRGDNFSALYKVTDDQLYDPFERRFENVLAGWSVDLNIEAPKYAKVC